MRAGIYHEEIQINNLNGTSSDPITFTNYQDEPVILDGTIPITIPGLSMMETSIKQR
jgi:hypothetical protein